MNPMKASELMEVLGTAMPGARVEARDDTHKHAEHNAEVDHYGSHFKVKVVWDGFEGMGRLARHRSVFGILRHHWDEKRIHSLSLRLLTTKEAEA